MVKYISRFTFPETTFPDPKLRQTLGKKTVSTCNQSATAYKILRLGSPVPSWFTKKCKILSTQFNCLSFRNQKYNYFLSQNDKNWENKSSKS